MRDAFLGQLALHLASSKPLTQPPYSSAHHVARPSKIPPFSTENQVTCSTLQNSASTCLARRHCSQPGTKKTLLCLHSSVARLQAPFNGYENAFCANLNTFCTFRHPQQDHTASHILHIGLAFPASPQSCRTCYVHPALPRPRFPSSLLPHFLLQAPPLGKTCNFSPNTNSRLAERRA